MKLYYMQTMNPRKACAVAKYLRSPVEYVPIESVEGGLKGPKFTALNPHGRAPVLEDSGKVLTESAAIMIYLAAKAGSSLWPSDPLLQAEVVRWMSWDMCEFAPNAGTYFFENFVKKRFGFGEPDPKSLEAKGPALHEAARVLDRHLERHPFLVGDELSLADFCVAVLLPWAEEIELPLADYRNIQRWHGELMKIDAWRNPWPE